MYAGVVEQLRIEAEIADNSRVFSVITESTDDFRVIVTSFTNKQHVTYLTSLENEESRDW